ncbi:MAG: TrbI/VirB10 family protein [Verrucomicrobiales bacterium]|nr:TrbI/VirB10 family protein [Verrucomicrobiales bacterium]
MNSFSFRRAVAFLSQTSGGRALCAVVLGVLAIGLVRGCSSKPVVHELTIPPSKNTWGEKREQTDPILSSPSQERSAPKPSAPKAAEPLPPISLYATPSADTPPDVSLPLMPTGRMVACRLVNTVDSSSLETPIIALVSEDVWFAKRLAIPKGTEILGRAQPNRLRDRIAAQGEWTLVLPSGEELSVTGIALDQDRDGEKWGPTDGTAGLRGKVMKADNLEEMKLFLATFLGGMAEPFKQRQSTVFGSQIAPTAQNAALSGVGEVINSYAAQVLRTIEAQATFVRVASGTDFWLFTTQPLTRPKSSPSNL